MRDTGKFKLLTCSWHGFDLWDVKQGSFFWLQHTEGEHVIGIFATNHQPHVLPLYF
jgi:hypothetical protein